MNKEARQAHLNVYNEMVAHYHHLGEPRKAEKYLRMIKVVQNCQDTNADTDTTIRVDRQVTKSKDVEFYCKPKVVRRNKK